MQLALYGEITFLKGSVTQILTIISFYFRINYTIKIDCYMFSYLASFLPDFFTDTTCICISRNTTKTSAHSPLFLVQIIFHIVFEM